MGCRWVGVKAKGDAFFACRAPRLASHPYRKSQTDLIRTQPFWVIGHEAQPSRALVLNHAVARGWKAWSTSSKAIKTFTSSNARISTHRHCVTCRSVHWALPHRASSEITAPAVFFSWRARSFTARNTSSSTSSVIRMNLRLSHQIPCSNAAYFHAARPRVVHRANCPEPNAAAAKSPSRIPTRILRHPTQTPTTLLCEQTAGVPSDAV